MISSLRTGADAACACCWGSPGLWPWRLCQRTDPEPSERHESLYPEDCLHTPGKHNTKAAGQSQVRLDLQIGVTEN